MMCIGDYNNMKLQMIINVMVYTVFGFGAYTPQTPPNDPFFGDTLEFQYNLNMAFVFTAYFLIMVMLCSKPCLVKFRGSSQVQEAEVVYEQHKADPSNLLDNSINDPRDSAE